MENQILCNVATEHDFKFSAHTSYGLGGTAKIAYFPKTPEEGAAVFEHVRKNYDKFVILGNGSNVLASESYYDGAVISTKLLSGISLSGDVLTCLGGTSVGSILKFCVCNGLSGLEYLAGIPASIGGIAFMNGGTAGRHIESEALSVTVFDGNLRKIPNKNCDFGNKHSTMRDIICLILSVELKVARADSRTVKQNIEKYLNLRKWHPKGRSCGCVFKNPEGMSAGKLIDEAGLKGLSRGKAFVSGEHANFIINDGASADDVRALIKEVKGRVYERFGVDLEEEVVYIGEFNDFNG